MVDVGGGVGDDGDGVMGNGVYVGFLFWIFSVYWGVG